MKLFLLQLIVLHATFISGFYLTRIQVKGQLNYEESSSDPDQSSSELEQSSSESEQTSSKSSESSSDSESCTSESEEQSSRSQYIAIEIEEPNTVAEVTNEQEYQRDEPEDIIIERQNKISVAEETITDQHNQITAFEEGTIKLEDENYNKGITTKSQEHSSLEQNEGNQSDVTEDTKVETNVNSVVGVTSEADEIPRQKRLIRQATFENDQESSYNGNTYGYRHTESTPGQFPHFRQFEPQGSGNLRFEPFKSRSISRYPQVQIYDNPGAVYLQYKPYRHPDFRYPQFKPFQSPDAIIPRNELYDSPEVDYRELDFSKSQDEIKATAPAYSQEDKEKAKPQNKSNIEPSNQKVHKEEKQEIADYATSINQYDVSNHSRNPRTKSNKRSETSNPINKVNFDAIEQHKYGIVKSPVQKKQSIRAIENAKYPQVEFSQQPSYSQVQDHTKLRQERKKEINSVTNNKSKTRANSKYSKAQDKPSNPNYPKNNEITDNSLPQINDDIFNRINSDRTYGFKLGLNNGYVWNNLGPNKYSYQIGEGISSQDDSKFEETNPWSQETGDTNESTNSQDNTEIDVTEYISENNNEDGNVYSFEDSSESGDDPDETNNNIGNAENNNAANEESISDDRINENYVNSQEDPNTTSFDKDPKETNTDTGNAENNNADNEESISDDRINENDVNSQGDLNDTGNAENNYANSVESISNGNENNVNSQKDSNTTSSDRDSKENTANQNKTNNTVIIKEFDDAYHKLQQLLNNIDHVLTDNSENSDNFKLTTLKEILNVIIQTEGVNNLTSFEGLFTRIKNEITFITTDKVRYVKDDKTQINTDNKLTTNTGEEYTQETTFDPITVKINQQTATEINSEFQQSTAGEFATENNDVNVVETTGNSISTDTTSSTERSQAESTNTVDKTINNTEDIQSIDSTTESGIKNDLNPSTEQSVTTEIIEDNTKVKVDDEDLSTKSNDDDGKTSSTKLFDI